MQTCNQLDLIVRDVPAATAFFRDVVGLPVRVEDARFAELDGGAITITMMLSPDALVPVQEAAGVMLHIQVNDVEGALEHAHRSGAAVLLEPTRTEWGTESAMIAGPEGIIVDFYRWVGPYQPEAAS